MGVQYLNIGHIESLFSYVLRNQDHRKRELEDKEIVKKVRKSKINIEEL